MFKFKKVASVLASAVMLGSTVALAAATTFPAPFTNSPNTVFVYGTTGAITDYAAITDIGSTLTGTASGGGGGTTSGEYTQLYTSSSKIYINDSLNQVKSVITKTELPTLLAQESFSGNVDAKLTQTVVLGSTPRITFAKQPASSNDPLFALATSSTSGQYTYNATVDFNKAVNLTHADSKNQELKMFGQKFIIGGATDNTNLILLKSATKLNFDSSGTTSQEVTIEGNTYTVEMVSASTTAATIKVTKSDGTSDQKEVSEGYSKKINGLTVAVNTADSNNLKYTASIVAGAEKITIPASAGAVTYGDSDTVIDGTTASITGGTTAATKIVVSIRAPSSDMDSLNPRASFTDPVFGTFKLDFPSLNIPDTNSTKREEIAVKPSGDDKMLFTLTDNRGNEKTVQWAINNSASIALQWDSDGHNIQIAEMAAANRSDYIVVGNEDEGRLLKVYQITNQTTGYSNDVVKFQDVFSGDTIETTITAEGSGTATIGGKVYTVNYYGASDLSDDSKTVRLDYPDSSSDMIIYPTFQTKNGAKVILYKPLTINLGNWDGLATTLGGKNLKIPNCADTYQSIAVTVPGITNFTIGGNPVNATGSTQTNIAITNTGFSFNFTYSAANTTVVYLIANDGGYVTDPAFVICEEKDDNNQYQGVIVTLEPGATGDDGVGVNDAIRTWSNDGTWDAITLASNSKKTQEGDLWGTIATIDAGDSDQKIATLSYPDEQVFAELYAAAKNAVIGSTTTTTTTTSTAGYVIATDEETASFADKNLIVIGGSCVNNVAAQLLGFTGKACGAEFTDKTGVGAGQYLIETFTRTGTTGKIATLVAGFNAADTTNAGKCLKAGTGCVAGGIDTAVGKKYTGTTATLATLATTTTGGTSGNATA